MARIHTRRPIVSSRRLTQWVAPPDQGFIAVASATKVIISSLSPTEPLTVVRTRGMISVHPTAFSADLDVVGAVGIGVVSNDAFAAGVGSIPGPYDDGDWKQWFVWQSFAFHVEFGSAVGVNIESVMIDVDSKAMRKVGQNETIVMVAESATGAYSIADATRQLVKLA